MYAFIRGKIAVATPTFITLDVSGVGYKIAIPLNTLSKLPETGEVALLYTSFVVRELFQGLYGFTTSEERDLFEVLIEISGIGPKTALNLIGHYPPDQLHTLILAEDTVALSKVPGIGKKTAERLLVELKGKLDAFPAPTTPLTSKKQNMQDALKALMKLGYNPSIAGKALKKSVELKGEEAEVGDLISGALRHV